MDTGSYIARNFVERINNTVYMESDTSGKNNNSTCIARDLTDKKFAFITNLLEAMNEINDGPLMRQEKCEKLIFLAQEMAYINSRYAD